MKRKHKKNRKQKLYNADSVLIELYNNVYNGNLYFMPEDKQKPFFLELVKCGYVSTVSVNDGYCLTQTGRNKAIELLRIVRDHKRERKEKIIDRMIDRQNKKIDWIIAIIGVVVSFIVGVVSCWVMIRN